MSSGMTPIGMLLRASHHLRFYMAISRVTLASRSTSDHIAAGDLAQWLTDRQLIIDSVRQYLQRMQHRMKQHANKKRLERVFLVGDLVFFKLQPYIQSSIARRANHKLSFKFFGPYHVCKHIGKVTYELELPSACRVCLVFHVSQLKPCIHPGKQVFPTLPVLDVSHQILVASLQHRVRQHGVMSIAQVLVHWSGSAPKDANWEDIDDLKRRFPHAPAWGQAAFKREQPGPTWR
jgi:hypothetical protein